MLPQLLFLSICRPDRSRLAEIEGKNEKEDEGVKRGELEERKAFRKGVSTRSMML